MNTDLLKQPLTLYGSNISYFTGKMENYFRAREIPYELRSMQFPADAKRFEKALGLSQMPTIQLADGRWMTDTTKIIQWFETELPDNGLIPADPAQSFICYLLEDWADEWWWRPAMHYRWHYSEGARFAAWHLANEVAVNIPAPVAMKWRQIRHRQRSGYTAGDGITKGNVQAVEQDFKQLLGHLNGIFRDRPFLLGDKPSLADIGFSGPFFRHFALDPVPLEIIRQHAPYVLQWVARLWNTRLSECSGEWQSGVPDDLGPLLSEIGRGYLPYLNANVEAVKAGKKRFDVTVNGVTFKKARYSRYRIWCLQELRDQFKALPAEAEAKVEVLLKQNDCWNALWQEQNLPLLANQEQGLPFRADTKMVGVNE